MRRPGARPDGTRGRALPEDAVWMRRALLWAARGAGRVSPNPLVGAIVVRGGRAVGAGFHARFGGAHAEARALARAGGAARGATLYVTLEPCVHRGKTPPCVDAIAAAGVGRVVVAACDPNPEVAGRGVARLRTAGIPVTTGVLRREAERQNAAYRLWRTAGRPLVTLKWAESADGRIAGPGRSPVVITGLAARRRAHALRAHVDAVLVGIGTVLADNPLLTARLVHPARQPVRIVLDGLARLPLTSRLVRSVRRGPVWVIATEAAPASRLRRLARAGCEVVVLPATPRAGGRRVDLRALAAYLGRRHVQHLLVEGGREVLCAFASAGLADRIVCWRAPRAIGARGLPRPFALPAGGEWSTSRGWDGRDLRIEMEREAT